MLYKGNRVPVRSARAQYSARRTYDEDDITLHRELEKRVKQAMLKGESVVSLEDLAISIDDMRYHVHMLRAYSPYLTVLTQFDTPYYTESRLYVEYDIENPLTVEETKQYFARIDRMIADIKEVVDEGEDAETKALLLHDYLVQNYAYDTAHADPENPESNNPMGEWFCSGGLLLNQIGVCQAYAYLYMYIMNLYDIPCTVLSSTELNHAWNLIQIDGTYYHTDVTWDDPTPDLLGQVLHENFLLSDEGIRATGHKSENSDEPVWDNVGIVCDKTYPAEKAYWTDVRSAIIWDDDDVYMIKDMKLLRCNFEDESNQTLFTFEGWLLYNQPGYYYPMTFVGLERYGDSLIFNTCEQIYRYDIQKENGRLQSIYMLPKGTEGYIYGMKLATGEVACTIMKDLNDEGRIAYYESDLPYLHGESGDVNRDRMTDLKDYMHMKKYEKKVITRKYMADDSDLTGDGYVDVQDLKALGRKLCGK